MPRSLIALLFVLFSVSANATDFRFGEHKDALKWKRYEKDTTANAVVIQEYGKGSIIGYETNPMTFYYHVCIKILNKKGFDEGTVVVPLQLSIEGAAEIITDIKAVCYTLKEDGTVQTTELDRKNIFNEHKNKYRDLAKFAIPNLQEGCVIEYAYQINSPFIFQFRDWEFQTHLPKMESLFEAKIPNVYIYNGALIGPQKLSSTKSRIDRACTSSAGFSQIDCSVLEYEMKDIPAFIEEAHMTAPGNYKSAIHFELSEYFDYSGLKHKVSVQWKDIDQRLKREEYFGKQITRKGLFKEVLNELAKDKTDELSKAKAIYYHYQKWFRWNGFVGIYSPDISKAIKDHSGSIADINLTLIAALTAAGLNTDAVLLSTRQNGVINKLYPVVGDFNYVVARVTIGKDSFLLDATEPLLPFGMLPLHCINDQGRVVNNKKESYWIDMKAAQKAASLVIFMLSLQPDGKVTGTWERQSKGYEAFYKRKEIKKFSTPEEYVEDMDEKNSRIKILKHTITNIDEPEAALSEKYEIEIKAFDSLGRANLILNPFMLVKVENPFKLAERTYPVDMGYASDFNFNLSLNFPKGYTIDGKPEYAGISLPASGGKFITEVNASENNISISQLVSLSRAIYSASEYPYLKEFYNKIVQTQKTDIVFKREI